MGRHVDLLSLIVVLFVHDVALITPNQSATVGPSRPRPDGWLSTAVAGGRMGSGW
jgi:hypothetical protein